MRPVPSESMFGRYGATSRFIPAPEIVSWAQTTFFDDDA